MILRRSLVVLPLLVSGAASAQSVSFDFSSLGSALISFQGTGGDFNFSPDSATGFDFQIAGATGSLAGLNGLRGNINGTFTAGLPSEPPSNRFQEAPVTGSGTLTISDNSGGLFTANIAASGYNAFTFGAVGGLNPENVINLSYFTYVGGNPSNPGYSALEQLANSGSAVEVVSFQFSPAEILSELESGGAPHSATFAGTVSDIPEPSTFAVILGCAALGFASRFRKATGRVPESAPPPP